MAGGTRGESMNGVRKLAEIPAGSWTKWVVVGFWVVVLVIMLPLSTKLTGAEKNDAKYWLPGNAESTKVLDVQSRFQSPNIYTGVVVYVRPSGITAADRARAAADAQMFAGVPGAVPGHVTGPIVSADGRAIETNLQVNLGSKGYANANNAVDAIGAITNSNANGLVSHITGPLGARPTATMCSRALAARCCTRPWRLSS
jgi:RND superfamily putative drug exporter